MFHKQQLSKLAEEFYEELLKNGFKTPKERLGELELNDLNIFKKGQKEKSPKASFKPNPIQQDIINYLKKNLKEIITADKDKMELFIQEFKKNNWDIELWNETQKDFGKDIEAAFAYTNFRESKKAVWLAKKLGAKTCLYCNTQYIFTVADKITFTFDHFYPKSIYPYLSLSFYNLIPACDYCNRRKSANEKKLFHPYYHNHHKEYKLRIEIKSLIDFQNTSFKDDNKLNVQVVLSASDEIKALDSMINIVNLYEPHKDIIAEIIWKATIYTPKYKQQLEDLLKEGNLDIDINRFITGNYIDEKDHHKRPLSKLTRDIAEDLGLGLKKGCSFRNI